MGKIKGSSEFWGFSHGSAIPGIWEIFFLEEVGKAARKSNRSCWDEAAWKEGEYSQNFSKNPGFSSRFGVYPSEKQSLGINPEEFWPSWASSQKKWC